MKCDRPSPYGKFSCQLEKRHEGACFDGTHHFTEIIDAVGRDLIFAVNRVFNLNIPVTQNTAKNSSDIVSEIVSEYLDDFTDGTDYGYCPSCDKRRSYG